MDTRRINVIDNLNNEELRRFYLTRYICQKSENLDQILNVLVEDDVITSSELNAIVNAPDCNDTIRGRDSIHFFHLYNIMAGKLTDDKSYRSFKSALKISNNRELWKLLETLTEDYRCFVCFDPYCVNQTHTKNSKKKRKLSSWETV